MRTIAPSYRTRGTILAQSQRAQLTATGQSPCAGDPGILYLSSGFVLDLDFAGHRDLAAARLGAQTYVGRAQAINRASARRPGHINSDRGTPGGIIVVGRRQGRHIGAGVGIGVAGNDSAANAAIAEIPIEKHDPPIRIHRAGRVKVHGQQVQPGGGALLRWTSLAGENQTICKHLNNLLSLNQANRSPIGRPYRQIRI